MPSFGKTQPDSQIWAIAAFLHKARGVSERDYKALTGSAAAAPAGATPNVQPSGSGADRPQSESSGQGQPQ
jgi:hypothetical protein